MIIVEGPDGAGKTTLIARLGFEARRLVSLRGGTGGDTREGWAAPAETTVNAYLRKLLGAAKAERDRGHQHIAWDRFHLSERVYGPILRQRQEVTDRDLYTLSTHLADLGVAVVLCLPPFEVTHAKTRSRPWPAYQTDAFLTAAYAAWLDLAPYASVVYDFTSTPDLPAALLSMALPPSSVAA